MPAAADTLALLPHAAGAVTFTNVFWPSATPQRLPGRSGWRKWWIDAPRHGRHNHAVSRSPRRVIAVLVLAPLLAGWAPIAPEHVHERDAHHGHTLVHRHLEPHHSADSHDADHAEVEAMLHHEHAGRLVWLTAASLHQVAYQLDLPPAILSAAMSARPPAISWIATQFNDAAPPHGPPRPSSPLRGPPSYPA